MLYRNGLIAQIAARNSIRVDPGDPAFALVTLVQLVPEKSSRQIADNSKRAAVATLQMVSAPYIASPAETLPDALNRSSSQA